MVVVSILFFLLICCQPLLGTDYFSRIIKSDPALEYLPAHSIELLSESLVDKYTRCALACSLDPRCRSFDFNSQIYRCRLFEGESSTGRIISSAYSTSLVGSIALSPNLYSAYNRTCDHCSVNRYLACQKQRCQCPKNLFWDGSICRNQMYANSSCNQNNNCRSADLNLTCVQANRCTPTSFLSPPYVCHPPIVVLDLINATAQNYVRYSSNFTASRNVTTITFAFQHDVDYWWLDDVSIVDVTNAVERVTNGGFEAGNLNGWNYCNPYGTQNGGRIGSSGSFAPHLGTYFYHGAPYPDYEYLNQSVATDIGHTYLIRFWLGNQGQRTSRALITWY